MATRTDLSRLPFLCLFTCLPLFLVTSSAPAQEEFESIDPMYWETDVSRLIQIRNDEDVEVKRQALIRYIWGQGGFPSAKLPDSVKKNVEDQRYADLYADNLKQIDRVVMNMDSGLTSIAYHFVPNQSNGALMIYHQGHRGDFVHGIETIRALVRNGYAVLAFSMPLLGMNSQPVLHFPRFGRFQLQKHDHLKLLERPIRFFLEPVAVGVNYAQALGYRKIHMIGISGGGWTTTLCAAIDARFSHSYPVAGTYPIYLRSNSDRDWGDYEQTVPELYRIANYLELYIMGSTGEGRKQLQILNQYDSCCFAGLKYQTYEEIVKRIVAGLGKGEFDIYLDHSHKEHKISEQAMEVVLRDLKR